jgi:hypothetical protein
MQRATPDSAQATNHAHFEAVAECTRDLASLQTFALATHAFAWLVLAALTAKPVWPVFEAQDWANPLLTMLEHWHWPLAGFALPFVYQSAGWAPWRLRWVFNRGLTSAEPYG